MINITDLCVKFGDKIVYDNFNITFETGKITAILGKSGCGKTTLFNVLNGSIKYSGYVENSLNKISVVYSDSRLIPTMTVEQNLKFILKDYYKSDILNDSGLENAKNLYPDELSSGMAQRVSLIRAILYPSDLILMDEPFANLDISTKYKLMNLFKNMQSKDNRTTLIISHDVSDAMFLADRIIIIDNNKIVLDMENDKSDSVKQKIMDTIMSL